MDLPKSIRIITGDNSEAQREIEKFFISTKAKLVAKGYEDVRGHFEVRLKNLCESSQQRQSDDMLHMLLYRERVIALVSETRTENNWVQYDFFQNLEGLV